MKYRAIAYDVGTFFVRGKTTRPSFDAALVKHEIAVIRNDLGCNAIRIFGLDIDRLVAAATFALEAGLAVWLSPMRGEATAEETLPYLAQSARRAEVLRANYGNVLLVVGGECSFFMKGIIPGDDLHARIGKFISPLSLLRHLVTGGRWPGKRLNAYLASAVATVREAFKGPVTYASGPWERVDWRRFDLVGANYYRYAQNAKGYSNGLKKYFKHGKPVLITELGCSTYEGADAKGAIGWRILDGSGPRTRIKGSYLRSEETQARYLDELLGLFADTTLEGVCVFNFVAYNLTYDEDPQWDLDMASYGIVKVLPEGVGSRQRSGLPWVPKMAFRVVADRYRAMEKS
ncbi:MAG TPA: hypothetical protein VGN07_02605 [Steroidobacteraceae bacterium]|jgi:hypothetical protein